MPDDGHDSAYRTLLTNLKRKEAECVRLKHEIAVLALELIERERLIKELRKK